jgi:hypothetical protein
MTLALVAKIVLLVFGIFFAVAAVPFVVAGLVFVFVFVLAFIGAVLEKL